MPFDCQQSHSLSACQKKSFGQRCSEILACFLKNSERFAKIESIRCFWKDRKINLVNLKKGKKDLSKVVF